MEIPLNANEVLDQLEAVHLMAYHVSVYSFAEQKAIAGDIEITETRATPEYITMKGGINDERMGPLTLTDHCQTCSAQNCPGHPGIIFFNKKDANDIINPLFKKTIIRILNCVCHTCSRVLFCNELPKDALITEAAKTALQKELKQLLKKSPESEVGTKTVDKYCKTQTMPEDLKKLLRKSANKKASLDIINAYCGTKAVMSDELKKILKKSPDQDARLMALEKYCHNMQCTCDYSCEENVSPCKPHIKFKVGNITDEGLIQYEATKKSTKDGKKDTFYTKDVKRIFKNISTSDANYLGFIGDTTPFDLIMQALLVLPPKARSPITDKNGDTIQNPITSLYLEVLRAVSKDAGSGKIYKAVSNLLIKYENFRRSGQDIKAVGELLLGKKGLFRMATVGKRVNWCGRSVVDPGQHLAYGQVALPLEWQLIFSKPRYVTNFNVEFMNELLRAGRIHHIIDNKGLQLAPDMTNPNGPEVLVVGQQVRVQLQEKDRIYMNRQPTLHRGSMQGFELVFEPGQVIKSHLSSTTNFNLDHDGDEMNVWVAQDLFVEAELEYIMNAKNCIISAASGNTAAGLVMNSVTAMHLINLSNAEVDIDVFEEMQQSLTDKDSLPTLQARMEKFGIQMIRTDLEGRKKVAGRAIVSMLLPVDFDFNVNDIQVREGVLLTGLFNKGKINKMIKQLSKKYSIDRAATFLTDAPHVMNIYIINRGFTVTVDDCMNKVVDSNAELVNAKYSKKAKVMEKDYQLVNQIVFGPKSWNTLGDLINKVQLVVEHAVTTTLNSEEFNQALSMLEHLRLLMIQKTGLRPQAKAVAGLKADFRDFLQSKKERKQVLKESLESLRIQVAELSEYVVSDPLISRIRLIYNNIRLGFMLLGEHVEDEELGIAIAKLQVGDMKELINQQLSRMIRHLTGLEKKRSIGTDPDVAHVLHKFDKLLRAYQFEQRQSVEYYMDFKNLEYEVLDIESNVKEVGTFLAQLRQVDSKYLLDIKESSGIVEDFELPDVVQRVATVMDEMKYFINNTFEILSGLPNDAPFKGALQGVANEVFLLVNGLLFQKWNKELRRAYNRNYVVKKEEIAKMLLDVKALGGKEGLSRQEAEFKELQMREKLDFAKVIGAKLAAAVPRSNAIVLQTEEGAGTKGSTTNLGQIMGAVGQLELSGKRLWHGSERLSSHFDEKDESPQARGLVESSFLEGLNPVENFFAAACGRESIVTTYMMTPVCGMLQRFMEISLTNMIVAYDGSVRSNQGFLYSTSYNSGFDISKSVPTPTKDKTGLSNFVDLAGLIHQTNHNAGWYTKQETKKMNMQKKGKMSIADAFAAAMERPKKIKINVKGVDYNNKLTLFEKTRLIGTRANMLNLNDTPRVPLGNMVDAMEIAKAEYAAGVLADDPALVIVRTMPDGSQVNVYPTLVNII